MCKNDVSSESEGQLKAGTVKINFIDFWSSFNIAHNFIIDTLKAKFEVQISDKPDILFCSHFGDSHKEYINCKKILVITEPKPYGLEDYDYAIGYPYLNDKRFLHYSIYEPENKKAIQDRRKFADISLTQRRFCNFIYSNETWGEGAQLRKQFCLKLSKYKHVDCPGKVLNNMQDVITPRNSREWVTGKQAFLKHYKFTIAFENHMLDGYTTEKLWDPLIVGSIPIYWGNPMIGKEICPEAFINCNEFDNDLDAVIRRVREIDMDDEYYMYMVQKSPFRKPASSKAEELGLFLTKIVFESYMEINDGFQPD